MRRATWPPGVVPEVRRLTVAGTTVRIATVGEGPPLLLLNGIGGNLEMWAPVVPVLPGRRLLMVEMPGAGRSPALSRGRRMPWLARLVVEVLDQMDVARADVLGYSWGGALAQELAHQAPERVRSLVLCATTCGAGGRPPAPWVAAIMLSPARYYSKTYLRLAAPIVFGSTPTAAADSRHGDARRAHPPSLLGYSQQLYAISGWTSRHWLRQLRVPTLVVSGARDPLVRPVNGRILARAIPGARLHVVDGGHLFLLERPDLAGRVIGDFLDELRATSPLLAAAT